MAGMCCGVVAESETAAPVEPSSRASRRRRLELRPMKLVADVAIPLPLDSRQKRQKLDLLLPLPSASLAISSLRDYDNAVENCKTSEDDGRKKPQKNESLDSNESVKHSLHERPKFGMTSVCGRRRDMEDAVSIYTSFSKGNTSFFGVFDGHGCSHVSNFVLN